MQPSGGDKGYSLASRWTWGIEIFLLSLFLDVERLIPTDLPTANCQLPTLSVPNLCLHELRGSTQTKLNFTDLLLITSMNWIIFFFFENLGKNHFVLRFDTHEGSSTSNRIQKHVRSHLRYCTRGDQEQPHLLLCPGLLNLFIVITMSSLMHAAN